MMRLRHHHSLRPINELFSSHRKMGEVDKRMGVTPTSNENVDENETTWITEQIKENIWKMLEEMKSKNSKQHENQNQLSNAMQRRYFRTT